MSTYQQMCNILPILDKNGSLKIKVIEDICNVSPADDPREARSVALVHLVLVFSNNETAPTTQEECQI